MQSSYFPCDRAQWVEVEGLIREADDDSTWQRGQLRAWSWRNGIWVGQVHCTSGPGRPETALLPPDRIRGAAPPLQRAPAC